MSDSEWDDFLSESDYVDESSEFCPDESDGDYAPKKAKSKAKAKPKKASPKKTKAKPKANAKPKAKPKAKAKAKPAAKKENTQTQQSTQGTTPAKSKKRKASSSTKSTSKAKAKAKPKAKKAKINDSDAKKMIADYLIRQNRPYSHTQVFENLHRAVKKSLVPKLLEQLHTEDVLQKYQWGKTKLYIANQEKYPPLDKDKMDEMDAEIKQLTETVNKQKSDNSTLSRVVAQLEAAPTDDEVAAQTAALTKEVEEKSAKLQRLSTEVVLVSKEDRQKTLDNLKKYWVAWKKRKRACMDMLDQALPEDSPMKMAEFAEQMGVETDEEMGIDYKEMRDFARNHK